MQMSNFVMYIRTISINVGKFEILRCLRIDLFLKCKSFQFNFVLNNFPLKRGFLPKFVREFWIWFAKIVVHLMCLHALWYIIVILNNLAVATSRDIAKYLSCLLLENRETGERDSTWPWEHLDSIGLWDSSERENARRAWSSADIDVCARSSQRALSAKSQDWCGELLCFASRISVNFAQRLSDWVLCFVYWRSLPPGKTNFPTYMRAMDDSPACFFIYVPHQCSAQYTKYLLLDVLLVLAMNKSNAVDIFIIFFLHHPNTLPRFFCHLGVFLRQIVHVFIRP